MISNIVGLDHGISSILKYQSLSKVFDNALEAKNKTEDTTEKDDIFEKSFHKNLSLDHFLFTESLVTLPFFSKYLFDFKNPTIDVLVQPPLG